MSRHGCYPTVSSSTIALLQERFKELERMKEKKMGTVLAEQLLRPDLHQSRPLQGPSFQPHPDPRQPPRDLSLTLSLNSQNHWIDPRNCRRPSTEVDPLA
ncbi:hypothetical protein SAY87_008176 [Trapa incisa]|uniref:Uncharacterized protein n=1 Tax=Trapa incisa TaxID=236973 RepID=A0AAN7QG38_9MYRT|nr:hypothetical protein SAY87_008176 [Trapa incisa]